MSDRENFVETNDLEELSDNKPSVELAQGQKEPEHIVFYDRQGRAIIIEPPSEEEISELLYRLENCDT